MLRKSMSLRKKAKGCERVVHDHAAKGEKEEILTVIFENPGPALNPNSWMRGQL